MQPIILASSSAYRKAILDKLHLDYQACSPDIDENPVDGETAEQLVARLAVSKAQAIANRFPSNLIIGSDQVAVLGDKTLGKPLDKATAYQQLEGCSGKTVKFLTGLCLLNSATGRQQVEVVPFSVHFRDLSSAMIERYLQLEQPFDCAGSFKCEGLGIALFERLEGDDPNTLIGLPLIRLIRMLEAENIRVI